MTRGALVVLCLLGITGGESMLPTSNLGNRASSPGHGNPMQRSGSPLDNGPYYSSPPDSPFRPQQVSTSQLASLKNTYKGNDKVSGQSFTDVVRTIEITLYGIGYTSTADGLVQRIANLENACDIDAPPGARIPQRLRVLKEHIGFMTQM
eukprot:CAMPEP_0173061270 /NCGR_PEP_ID=MMETSP1102-20130122/3112_1 /TAXON_ID=49646 /ORGANISM="Geminigera sp., Strain Caron Lab Isolate" /LENGTH=149 /DNA_ID=CAMNT_0013927697 /DNA_START=15 /DNA_END=464 /DNA_ORIENTATION=-